MGYKQTINDEERQTHWVDTDRVGEREGDGDGIELFCLLLSSGIPFAFAIKYTAQKIT